MFKDALFRQNQGLTSRLLWKRRWVNVLIESEVEESRQGRRGDHAAQMKIILGIVSGVISVAFTGMGGKLLFAGFSPLLVRAVGFVLCAYGLGSLALLVWAWRYPRPKFANMAAATSTVLVLVWSLGSFDNSMISGLEIVAILAVAGLGWINCYTIRRIVRPKD